MSSIVFRNFAALENLDAEVDIVTYISDYRRFLNGNWFYWQLINRYYK
jgi:hypothetical protein